MTAPRFISTTLMTAALTIAGWWSVAMGCADIRIRRNEVAAALGTIPDNADYHSRLARAGSEDPRRAASLLYRAIQLNPWDSPSWIELGLIAERNRDYSQAEALLLHAADIDRQYQPRWSLANFYARRHSSAQFWVWAKSTIALAQTDPFPILRLCGRMSEDGFLIERAGIHDPTMQASYLDYLLIQNRPDLLQEAVRRVIENHRPSNIPLLLNATEQLLGARQDSDAIQLWRHLASNGLLPWRPTEDPGNLLSNARFSVKPTSRGFDWRLVRSDGVDYSVYSDSGGLDIDFTGDEPEHFQLITQLVPVEGRRKYELSTEFRTNPAGLNGLAWYILDARTAGFLMSGDIASRLKFEAPPDCRLIDLALRYNRPHGSTRIKGTLTLKSAVLRRI